jgi:hypothetical protein
MGLATGCSSQCEAVCEDYNACSVKERATDLDCPHYCSDMETLQERAVQKGQENCDAKWKANLDCWEKNSAKICDEEFTDCSETALEWIGCMTAYCAEIKAAGATDQSCSDGMPTISPF